MGYRRAAAPLCLFEKLRQRGAHQAERGEDEKDIYKREQRRLAHCMIFNHSQLIITC